MSEATANVTELEAGSEQDIVDQLETSGLLDIITDEAKQKGEVEAEVEAKPEGDVTEVEDDKEPDLEAEKDAEKEESPADEEMISYENADGEKVEVSLNDALDSYGQVETLTARNAELETQAQAMPEQVAEVVGGLRNEASQYATALSAVMEMMGMQNGEPIFIPEITDDVLERDPVDYQDQKNARRDKMEQMQRLSAEFKNTVSRLDGLNSIDQEGWKTEQTKEITKFWPEFYSDKDVKKEFTKTLKDAGFTDEESSSVVDHRQVALIKELIQFRAKDTKASGDVKKAMKIVRNNPTLVKRGAKAPHTTKDENAMNRLRKSGSDDDAVAALMAMK